MNRRVDFKTAELVDIALLTRAAFGPDTAKKFLELRGVDTAFMREMLTLPAGDVRSRLTFTSSACEGRRSQKRD